MGDDPGQVLSHCHDSPTISLGLGSRVSVESSGLLTCSWLSGEPQPWTTGSGNSVELWEEGLTLSIWAPSVDLVLPWTLPPPGWEV